MDKLTTITDDDDDEVLPLTDAKRQAALAFENRYLHRVMRIARGSVSEAARLSKLDRTNFRRLLRRHEIDPAVYKADAHAAEAAPTYDRSLHSLRSVGAAS